jgi:ribonuclease HI
MKVTVYADGGAKGTEEAVAGASIQASDGQELSTVSENLGKGTNNIAEYNSAIKGLEKALELGATEVELVMDSQLVVRQLLGQYAVTKDHLVPLHKRLMELSKKFRKFNVRHVPRELNKRADELAGMAYTEKE